MSAVPAILSRRYVRASASKLRKVNARFRCKSNSLRACLAACGGVRGETACRHASVEFVGLFISLEFARFVVWFFSFDGFGLVSSVCVRVCFILVSARRVAVERIGLDAPGDAVEGE